MSWPVAWVAEINLRNAIGNVRAGNSNSSLNQGRWRETRREEAKLLATGVRLPTLR